MNRIVFGIVAVFASFMLAESLTCNQCSFGLFGYCLNSADQVCGTNVTNCYTGRATFASLSSFSGFTTQGCLANASSCNTTTSATLLSVAYTTRIECCATDKCNPVTLSAAPSTKMTFTAVIGAALLASVSVSML